MNNKQKDQIYKTQRESIGQFVFDEGVADVFDDMIERSVPGYKAIVHMTGCLARQHAKEDSFCYDLGCSLGASTLAMHKNIVNKNCRIISVDNSKAMIEKFQQTLKTNGAQDKVEVICDDIENVTVKDASVVVMNFTLQFIKPEQRKNLIQRIYDGMLPGGIYIVSEKIAFEDKKEGDFQAALHDTFKKLNGYSDLEISQKRTALEDVLIPDTLKHHKERFRLAGFRQSYVWFQCFNFVSMVAVK